MSSSQQYACVSVSLIAFKNSWKALTTMLLVAALGLSGCEEAKPLAGPADVEVVQVVQKDVPITREWVATRRA